METDSLVERLAPDREMAEPSYLQLARKLSWFIESGEIPHGQRVRLGDGAPLSREVAWYDLTAAPDLAEWDVVGVSLPVSLRALRHCPDPWRANH